ncbi:MAG TPA: metal ABC transporter ATP-binding protein [Clostridia bacterium]|nr:metal ABC transporter ATP-binding protein [Clostridia bacterium]HOK82215.1 metal ABC transporter ATP-binding protein [Clostridia bacterium]HOL61322.1 metal ABC transporter ATP-binding protein [Clostridia bacterium]HPO54029.1 metal ABC transporter ATP-binding protein [Clostridia bacterium]
MRELLICKGATFSYEGMAVIKEADFTAFEGEYLCVTGENGSGKSTLIKGILGLKQPAAGKIEYAGGLKKREIGYLPQQAAVKKDFPAGVLEVALSGCLNGMGLRPFYNKADKERARECLELMGVYRLKNRSFGELSGGEQRRVLLARALCSAKRLLVLDEPVSGLDPSASRELYDTVKMLNEDRGITIIMVTHDIDAALTYANKILCLDCGKAFYGTPEEFSASHEGKKLYGGHRHA